MEITVRNFSGADLPGAERLWRCRFDDPEDFVRFFFTERYCPALSAGVFEGEKLLSAIHGTKTMLRIRGKELAALLISGVATDPLHEKRGFMHLCMEKIYRTARENGCTVVFHRPESFLTYKSMQQLPGTDTGFVHGRGATGTLPGMDCALYGKEEAAHPAFDEICKLYLAVTGRYSGSVRRSPEEMQRRFRDYASCGGRVIFTHRAGGLSGYAVYDAFDCAPEVIGERTEDYVALLSVLPQNTECKIPPDVYDSLAAYGMTGRKIPGNAYGAADVSALLAAFCSSERMLFRIREPLLPENTGLFDGTGRRLSEDADAPAPEWARDLPCYVMTGGELMQAILGYRALSGCFEKENCWCVDEY